jgi:hypothetical protein
MCNDINPEDEKDDSGYYTHCIYELNGKYYDINGEFDTIDELLNVGEFYFAFHNIVYETVSVESLDYHLKEAIQYKDKMIEVNV